MMARLGMASIWVAVTLTPATLLSLSLLPISACLLCPLICRGNNSVGPVNALLSGLAVGGGIFAGLHFQFATELWLWYQIAIASGSGWTLGLFLAPPVSNEVGLNPLWWGVYSPAAVIVLGWEMETAMAFSPVPAVFGAMVDDY